MMSTNKLRPAAMPCNSFISSESADWPLWSRKKKKKHLISYELVPKIKKRSKHESSLDYSCQRHFS